MTAFESEMGWRAAEDIDEMSSIEGFVKYDNALPGLRLTDAANWGQSELSARLLQKLHSDPT